MDENEKIKDPCGLVRFGRKGKVILVENHLSALTREGMSKGGLPYGVHSPYSVFKIVLLEAGKSSCSFNIKPRDLPDIVEKTKYANSYLMNARLNKESNNNVSSEGTPTEKESPAFTVKFFLGEFKGLSPAEVLLKDAANKNKLQSQIEFLNQNIDKYPRNKIQIDAISEAIKLSDEGKLQSEAENSSSMQSSGTRTFSIYEEDVKIPNIEKLDEDGNTFVYSCSIKCNPEMTQPITVEVMNCYAPPIPGEKTKAKLSAASKKTVLSFVLTEKEWNSMVSEMVDTEKTFKMTNYNRIDQIVKAYMADVKKAYSQK